VVDSCEHSNEISASMKCEEFLDQLSDVSFSIRTLLQVCSKLFHSRISKVNSVVLCLFFFLFFFFWQRLNAFYGI
jgi:hypothetical protein